MTKLFLATTALSEFWDKNQEILFLGSWCLRYDRRAEWEGLKYHVMPSPWDDRKRFYDACVYLGEHYELLLSALSDYLNAVHRVSFDERYWRILIGPWLLHSLHVAYDRYVCLLEAFHRYPDLQTIALDHKSFRVPRTTIEYNDLSRDDAFNLQIISQHLRAIGYTFPVKDLQAGWPEIAEGGWRTLARHGAKRTARFMCNTMCRMWRRESRIALCYLYRSHLQVAEIAWRTKFQAVPFEDKTDWSPTLPEPCFDERRNGLALISPQDKFEHTFIQSLPQNFPLVYLEGFQKVREEMLRKIPVFPQALVSAIGWWFTSEPFKFLAAEASQRGSRLIAVQHGGGYGMSRYHPCEEHESGIADSYLVWGWAAQGSRSCRNLLNPKLSSLPLNFSGHSNRHKNKTILFVATDCPRYLYRFHSSPTGTQWTDYIDWERKFLEAVPTRLRSAILFRPHESDYGHVMKDQIAPRFPQIAWDKGIPFHRRLYRCRFVVIDHPGTTLLEALAANIPTVLFWDPRRWEMRREAEPYLECLRKVSILWDSPEAAAAMVKEIYDGPWSWWGSPEVQQVRKAFADRYALAREDWTDCWANALAEELNLDRKDH